MRLLTYAVFVHLLRTTAQHQQLRQHHHRQQRQQQNEATTTSREVDCEERASCLYADDSRRNCYCDDLCHAHDDCCADYDVTMTLSTDVMTPSRGAAVSCQRLTDVMTTRDVDAELYVVSRCPSSYSDAVVRRLCRLHSSNNAADRFYRVPVAVRSDPLRLIYRNVYCASCTAVGARATFYVAEVRCKSLPVSADVTVGSLLRSSACRVVFVAPPSVTSRRTCRPTIGRCDRRWADTAVTDRCRRGPVSYVYAGDHAFRNRHCARCNYVNDTYVSCDVAFRPRSAASAASWGAAVVIDLNHGRSVLNYVTRDQQQHRQAVLELPQCRRQHVYDPFVEQCRHVPSLLLEDDDLTTASRPDVTDSVAVLNASDARRDEFGLYSPKTGAERVTALLAAVVSMIALVVVVVVYALRPALRADVHGRTLLAVVLSLLLTQLVYLFVVPLVDVIGSSSVTCLCFSVALHYASLTSVCWLNALAVSSLETSNKCSFTRSCVYAMSTSLLVVLGMLVLSVLRLDGSDVGPSCWTLGVGQLTLHVTLLAAVLAANCVLYVVTACRGRGPLTGPMYVSLLLTVIVMTDAALTVAAAVRPRSTGIAYLSLAVHAVLGPLMCLSTLLPVFLRANRSLLCQHVYAVSNTGDSNN